MTLPFGRPLVLLLLAVPAVLLWRVWRRDQGRLVLPFDFSGARRGRPLAFAVNLAESLPALLLAVVIAILASPQQAGAPKNRRALTNIEFCVDISGSMGSSFGSGTRYDAAMEAINKFVDYRRGDAFGLTFFGNNVMHWVPLTSDVSAIKCAPPFMSPQKAPPWFGGTEIGKALVACRRVLREREEGDRMIVLVSDGMSADLYGDRAQEIGQQLKESNIVVHAVHIAETTIPGDIVNLVAITGGEVFEVDDPQTLINVFARIDKMQQTELVQLAPETFDHFGPYCIAGLSLLGLMSTALFGLRYTPW
ncbi:MAG: VWA domain-containing protein [Planctomycetia bacterium]|nr:VWA domain-containing protein [Planctomycetia bacterium]